MFFAFVFFWIYMILFLVKDALSRSGVSHACARSLWTHLSPGLWSGGAEMWAWTPLGSAARCHSWGPVWFPLTCWPATEPASPCHLSCFAADLWGCLLAQCYSLCCTAALDEKNKSVTGGEGKNGREALTYRRRKEREKQWDRGRGEKPWVTGGENKEREALSYRNRKKGWDRGGEKHWVTGGKEKQWDTGGEGKTLNCLRCIVPLCYLCHSVFMWLQNAFLNSVFS